MCGRDGRHQFARLVFTPRFQLTRKQAREISHSRKFITPESTTIAPHEHREQSTAAASGHRALRTLCLQKPGSLRITNICALGTLLGPLEYHATRLRTTLL